MAWANSIVGGTYYSWIAEQSLCLKPVLNPPQGSEGNKGSLNHKCRYVYDPCPSGSTLPSGSSSL
ncbi:hypothetical protein I79_017863 [Cricetulus griseus]|uniref:Uncharacterized protein n=1 Tax=Cricetulus griseus TaxID=10029 RepID=G3I362_CRIGR|nr:hypothetical protein I79_017863 [Cricetulus griseus]